MLNTSLFVLALALVLLPAIYAFFSELLAPAARYPEAGYSQRISALTIQQALSLPGLLILVLSPFLLTFSTPPTVVYWLLVAGLWLLQVPLFWLRMVDLRQAARSVNWAGAKKRNSQIQVLLVMQMLLGVVIMLTGVEWAGSLQSA
ncbi:hypothetical protein [Oceanospirillum linum]|nr:hypothetical protein [Oceanospirillum linum]SEG49728.1 hypothetical protein SAMN04489856_11331 [Oleiphilus messinensis]SMP22836.1 hypothetical protein SAMN06264348_104293 [Oceanospirillum linum]